MFGGQEIHSSRGVVSGACYAATARLLDPPIRDKYGIPWEVPGVKQSAGFIMCNLGIKSSIESIGGTRANTWHIPIAKDGDPFAPLESFFKNPLGDGVDIPVFITFPSAKDRIYAAENPEKTSAQMLILAEYDWFEKYLGPSKRTNVNTKTGQPSRLEGYGDAKNMWADKCLQLFLRYFPDAKGKIDHIDVSTPLSIEQWLHAHRGGAVGLDVTPARYCNPAVRELLDPVSRLPGLYLTGKFKRRL